MNFFDRLAQGPQNLQQQDYNNWNEMVGAAPPERFGRAVYDSVRQVDPREYYEHTQPGYGGTDPFGTLQPQQRGGLAQSIIGELTRRGLGMDQIMGGAGLRTSDPYSMGPDDLASLSQWTQQNHPKAFGRVATQYQQEPGILQSLLGNKALMMAAAGIGAKILMDRASRR